jgi:hypothetical protein
MISRWFLQSISIGKLDMGQWITALNPDGSFQKWSKMYTDESEIKLMLAKYDD